MHATVDIEMPRRGVLPPTRSEAEAKAKQNEAKCCKVKQSEPAAKQLSLSSTISHILQAINT